MLGMSVLATGAACRSAGGTEYVETGVGGVMIGVTDEEVV